MEGNVKSISIFNFHGQSLDQFSSECENKPLVIQTEFHLYLTKHKMIEKLRRKIQ